MISCRTRKGFYWRRNEHGSWALPACVADRDATALLSGAEGSTKTANLAPGRCCSFGRRLSGKGARSAGSASGGRNRRELRPGTPAVPLFRRFAGAIHDGVPRPIDGPDLGVVCPTASTRSRSTGRDSCSLAKEKSWRTRFSCRSLLSRTNPTARPAAERCDGALSHRGRSRMRLSPAQAPPPRRGCRISPAPRPSFRTRHKMGRSKAFGKGSATNQSPGNGPVWAAADICDSLRRMQHCGDVAPAARLHAMRAATLRPHRS